MFNHGRLVLQHRFFHTDFNFLRRKTRRQRGAMLDRIRPSMEMATLHDPYLINPIFHTRCHNYVMLRHHYYDYLGKEHVKFPKKSNELR